MKALIDLQAASSCLRESLRVCLKAHNIELPAEILIEAGNNMAAGLMSIDENCPECDGTGILITIYGIDHPCPCTRETTT